MSWHVRVISNRYADSVRLMGISRKIRDRADVRRCELGMGTPANLELLAGLGASAQASASDLVIAIDADNGAAEHALALAESELETHPGAPADGTASDAAPAPRSIARAARELNGANVALISVPGEYAALEAHQALSAGMHVFLFSDHVPLDAELELKRRGAELGLLVMGPECGTAMLGGVGLGFANVVAAGPVGIVAAAGTGAQESACLLDAAGVGVSHIIGVGGRDLSKRVGGIMFMQGIRLLAQDGDTETLLLVSKPPSAEAVRALAEEVPDGMRVVAAFVGWDRDAAASAGWDRDDTSFEVHPTLEAGAAAAAGRAPVDGTALEPDLERELERELDERVGELRGRGRRLLGLYSGGSLAHEAATILEPDLGPLSGNVGHGPAEDDGGHRIVDLGEAKYTRGRPHPMVDLATRVEMLEQTAVDERIGCVLIDVVLGYGGHPDPADGLAEPLSRCSERGVVVAHVCGTSDDPQNATRQEQTLRDAGAIVAPSNAAAARLALRAVQS
jgi:FdrA protein